jgi:UPF0755 protein
MDNPQGGLKKKRNLAVRIFGWLGAIVATAVVVFVVWFIVCMQPVGSDSEERAFTVGTGETLDVIGSNLQKEGLVKNRFVFAAVAKLTNKTITAGVHYLAPSQSVLQIALELQKPAGSDQVRVTILAGQTLAELKTSLVKAGFTEAEVTAALAKNYSSPLLADKPASATLEGYIFPDTYHLDSSSDVAELIQAALDNLYSKLKSDGSLDAIRSQNKTIFQTLTLASIVQKEVSDPEEQKSVAGVFANRLQLDMPLGSDVTFHYAFKQGLCSANTPECDSIYNTRIHKGLPPGPIANMEYTAIQAVLHPTDSEYLFFVAGDNGKTYYAIDEDGHYENIQNYCHELCR